MNDSTVHLLNSEGHLTEDGILLYYQHMEKDQVEEIPSAIFDHVGDCLACRVELLRYQSAVTKMKDTSAETPVVPINEPKATERKLHRKPPNRKRFWPLLAAASMVGLLFFTGLYLSQNTDTPTTEIAETPIPNIAPSASKVTKNKLKENVPSSEAKSPTEEPLPTNTNEEKVVIEKVNTAEAESTVANVEKEKTLHTEKEVKPVEKEKIVETPDPNRVAAVKATHPIKSVEEEVKKIKPLPKKEPTPVPMEVVVTTPKKEVVNPIVTPTPITKKEKTETIVNLAPSVTPKPSVNSEKVVINKPSTPPRPKTAVVINTPKNKVENNNKTNIPSLNPVTSSSELVPKPKTPSSHLAPRTSHENPSRELFAMHYAPAELYINTIRSADNNAFNEVISKAGEAYEAGKLKEAAQLFKKALEIDPSNMTLQFYEAVSLLSPSVNRVGEAQQIFKKIVADKDNYFIEQGEWYLALSYLKDNNEKQAQTWLTKIKEFDGRFANKASKILEELSK